MLTVRSACVCVPVRGALEPLAEEKQETFWRMGHRKLLACSVDSLPSSAFFRSDLARHATQMLFGRAEGSKRFVGGRASHATQAINQSKLLPPHSALGRASIVEPMNGTVWRVCVNPGERSLWKPFPAARPQRLSACATALARAIDKGRVTRLSDQLFLFLLFFFLFTVIVMLSPLPFAYSG